MFGAAKITGGLSVPKVLEVASALNGKSNLFDQLLGLIESPDKRYDLAKRYQRHRVAIDVIHYSREIYSDIHSCLTM